MHKIAWVLLYLDPFTGSLLVQFLIAAISGIILFFQKIKLRIKYLFYRIFKKNPEEEE